MQYQEPRIIDLGPIANYVYGVPGGKEKDDVITHLDIHGECSAASTGNLFGSCGESGPPPGQ